MMMVIQIQRLDKGIATLVKTAKDVSSLKEEKKIAANALIEKCDKERIKVDAEKAIWDADRNNEGSIIELEAW